MRLFAAILLIILPTVFGQAFATQTAFKRIQLGNGLSIEIPSHWNVLSQSTRENLNAAGEAILEEAKVQTLSSRKETLLAVNATPDPTGAMIRVSVTKPPEYSQQDLRDAKPSDLTEISTELLVNFKKLELAGGPKIIQMQAASIDTMNNRKVLVLPYRRESKFGASPWQVTQYKIPLNDRLIEITFSYRESDQILWQPIVNKVKRSIRF